MGRFGKNGMGEGANLAQSTDRFGQDAASKSSVKEVGINFLFSLPVQPVCVWPVRVGRRARRGTDGQYGQGLTRTNTDGAGGRDSKTRK